MTYTRDLPPNTSMTTPNDPHATTLTSYFKRAQLH